MSTFRITAINTRTGLPVEAKPEQPLNTRRFPPLEGPQPFAGLRPEDRLPPREPTPKPKKQ